MRVQTSRGLPFLREPKRSRQLRHSHKGLVDHEIDENWKACQICSRSNKFTTKVRTLKMDSPKLLSRVEYYLNCNSLPRLECGRQVSVNNLESCRRCLGIRSASLHLADFRHTLKLSCPLSPVLTENIFFIYGTYLDFDAWKL